MDYYADALTAWERGARRMPIQCQHRGHKGRCQLVSGHHTGHIPNDQQQAQENTPS